MAGEKLCSNITEPGHDWPARLASTVRPFLIRDSIYVYTWMIPAGRIPGAYAHVRLVQHHVPHDFNLGSALLRSLSGDDWRRSPI